MTPTISRLQQRLARALTRPGMSAARSYNRRALALADYLADMDSNTLRGLISEHLETRRGWYDKRPVAHD